MQLIVTALFLLTTSLMASKLSGSDLFIANESALNEVIVELDENSILAWESKVDGDEVLVSVLAEDDIKVIYGCHYHAESMACHEESYSQGDDHDHDHHEHKSLEESSLDFMKEAHQAAKTKFEKTLKRQRKDLSIITTVKVWKQQESHDDHGGGHDHGANIWTKFDYTLKDQLKTIFVICHVHGHDHHFSCHYAKEGVDEPTL